MKLFGHFHFYAVIQDLKFLIKKAHICIDVSVYMFLTAKYIPQENKNLSKQQKQRKL